MRPDVQRALLEATGLTPVILDDKKRRRRRWFISLPPNTKPESELLEDMSDALDYAVNSEQS